MKKLCALALSVILLFLLLPPVYAADSVTYRTRLTVPETEIYDAAVKQISARTPSFTVTISTPQTYPDAAAAQKSLQDASLRAYEAFYRDHPEIFWVRKSGVKVRADVIPDADRFKAAAVTISVTFIEPTKIAEKQTALDTAVNKILSSASGSAYEKVKTFHHAIIAACAYDTAAQSSPVSYPDAFEAYGALVTGKAVCEGYSKAFKLLCDKAGIPCVIVGGTAQNQPHMWNAVELDGAFYLVDCTFDDPIGGAPTTDYLLKGSVSTASDHKTGGGFLQNFDSKFIDPTLSEKDYVPGKGRSSAEKAKKAFCRVDYSQSRGGSLVVAFAGGTGRVDAGQTVPTGVGVQAIARPASGYILKELRAQMGDSTLICDSQSSGYYFNVTDDCRVTAIFQRTQE